MASLQFPLWTEQQSLFKLSCADADTCTQLSSVVSVNCFCELAICQQNTHRTTQCLNFRAMSLISAPRRWPFHALLKVQNPPLLPRADFTEGMFVEHASLAGRGRQSAQVINLAVVIAEKLGLSAAILMENERNPNGAFAAT